MASPRAAAKQLLPVFRAYGPRRLLCASPPSQYATRSRLFSTTSPHRTDGVFRGLTDTRLPMPWIEAFRLQQAGQKIELAEAHGQGHDLTPRKMSDSYHRVVLPLGRDPWLSDTYINSSGHIR